MDASLTPAGRTVVALLMMLGLGTPAARAADPQLPGGKHTAVGGTASANPQGAAGKPMPAPKPLRQAAKGRILVGAAVMADSLDDPAFAKLVAEQFDSLTGENDFKPLSLQPEPGKFNFGPADRVIAFAREHDMKVVGHTLVWHFQSPGWMFADDAGKPLPREKALANLKAHIDAVAGHFRGKVIGWDVVNEALADEPETYLRDTPARRAIGDDYVVKAFQFAAAADPGAKLYYNDYSIEWPGKREKALRLLGELKAAGVKVAGIGIQGHWSLDQPDAKTIDAAIGTFAKAGVKVMITELDIDVLPGQIAGAQVTSRDTPGADPYVNGLPEDVAAKQGRRYAEVFRVFKKHRGNLTRVTFWGVGDGKSWLNDWPVKGRTNHPLLWDRQLSPKSAYEAAARELGT